THPFGHFRETQNRVSTDGEIDVRLRSASAAYAIKPVFLQTRDIRHRERVGEALGIHFVGENSLGLEFSLVLARIEINRSFSPSNRIGQALLVHSAARNEHGKSARKLSQQMSRVGDIPVGGNLARPGTAYAARKLRVARGEHQRDEFMREQIANN